MSISEENNAKIIANMNQIEEPRSTGMSFDNFVKEFARYLAQADKDKEALLGAKFVWEDKELYNDYLYVLTDERAIRIVAEGKKTAIQEELTGRMKIMKLYLDTLIKVCKFIKKRTRNSAFAVSFNLIENGSSTITILNNIIGLVELIETEPALAARIAPGSVDITPEYLALVKSDARHCITLYAAVNSSESERSIQVAVVNRLITLCLDAIDEIIEYADAAFITNRAYFKEHYSNHVRRAKYRKALRKKALQKEVTPTEPNTESQEVETEQQGTSTEQQSLTTELQELTTEQKELTSELEELTAELSELSVA